MTLQSFIGDPAGAPAPQRRLRAFHRLDTSPSAAASLTAMFSAGATVSSSLTATIPNANPATTYTAETFNAATGQLVVSMTGTPANTGAYTFSSTGTTYQVTAGVTYITEIVANSAVTPAPTPTPTAIPTATPTAPASVAIAQFTAPGSLIGLAISPSSRPFALDIAGMQSIDELNANGTITQNPQPFATPPNFEFNTQSTFADPTFALNGYLYAPAEVFSGTGTLVQFDPTNDSEAGYTLNTGFSDGNPVSVVIGPDNGFWVTDEGSNQIDRVDPAESSESQGPYTLPSSNALPQQIVVGPDNALWFTEIGADKIGRITTAGQITEFPQTSSSCVSIGIASGPLGSLWYVGCSSGSGSAPTIVQVTTSGVQTVYNQPANFGAANPQFIVAGKDGALWFTDENADYVGRFAPAGNGTATWTKYPYPLQNDSGQGSYAGANWIKSAPDGTLWFTSSNTNSFYHVTP